MIKAIKPDNKIFKSEEFQKDRYKFIVLLSNLDSETLELYSDEENYLLCRGNVSLPTWIWTKDNFDKSLLSEIEEAIDMFRLEDTETRFTCKKELYDLLVSDYNYLGDYFFEMGYLVCKETKPPKKTDGYMEEVKKEDEEILTKFIYNETREISDVRELSMEESKDRFYKRLNRGNYYVWKNDEGKIVCQADYNVVDGNAKMGGVYTLPESRGKGYAANIIYNLTNKALKEGHHVSLYTDYRYIPSNRAYKNVGYVDDDILINFSCKKISD